MYNDTARTTETSSHEGRMRVGVANSEKKKKRLKEIVRKKMSEC